MSSEQRVEQNARVSRFIEEGHPSTQQSHSLQLHRRRIDNRLRPYPPVRQPSITASDELCLPQPQHNPYADPSCGFMLQSVEDFLHVIPKKTKR
ncbi:MAG: hypothetical protein ACPGUD_07650 [Parashewanella sp.]